MMSGSGVSSRSRALGGMNGRKRVRIGFTGGAPTMAGNAVGRLDGSMFAMGISWPNESRASRGPLRCHSQDPSIEHEPDRNESYAANNFPGSFEFRADERERSGYAGEHDDGGEDHADGAFADDQAGRE